MKKISASLVALALAAVTAFAAAADGTWTITGSVGNAPQTLVLHVSGSTVTGTSDGVTISHGGISQNVIWFQVTQNGSTVNYKGMVSSTTLKLFQESQKRTLIYNHQ